MSYEERLDKMIAEACIASFGEKIPDDEITVLEMQDIGSLFFRSSTKQCFLFTTPPKIVEGEIEIRTCVIQL
jgi:hypothetical protein